MGARRLLTRSIFLCLCLCLLPPAERLDAQVCVEVTDQQVDCLPGTGSDFMLTLSLLNHEDTPFDIDRVFVWVDPLAPYSVSPDELILETPIAPGEIFVVELLITGADPGAQICFELSVHDSTTGECCGHLVCFDADCSDEPQFIRGDINDDGAVNIGDAIFLLSELFSMGTPSPCQDSSDANDDGMQNIADAIFVLGYLFSSGASPPPPFPDCGTDPTADPLECASFVSCP